ncbi:uncharacterized protein [Branchiostoma lanceolatum]|uniref:uncharacterized protein n=1 Tax=Branchiostoma lanceolatum TaxID=7740 RepID=UPI003455F96D
MMRKGEFLLLEGKKGHILRRKALVNNQHLQFELGMLEQEKRRAEVRLRSKKDQLLRQFQNLRKRSDEIRKDLEHREHSPRKTCIGPSALPSSSTTTSSEENPGGSKEDIFRAGEKTETARKRWSIATCAVGCSQHIQRLRGFPTFPSHFKPRFKITENDKRVSSKDETVSKRRESLDPTMLASVLDVDSSIVKLDVQVYARVQWSPTAVRKTLALMGDEEHNGGKTVPSCGVTRQRRASVACPTWTSRPSGTRLPPLTSNRMTDTAVMRNGASVHGRRHSLPEITVTHPPLTVESHGHVGGIGSCLGFGTMSRPRKSSVTFAERNIIKEDDDDDLLLSPVS